MPNNTKSNVHTPAQPTTTTPMENLSVPNDAESDSTSIATLPLTGKRKASIDIDELKTKKTKTEAEFFEDDSEEDEHDREGSYHIIKFAVQQEFAHTMNSHLSSTELDFRDHSYKCEIINEEVSTLEEACDAADWEQANECSDNEIVLVGDGYNTPRYNAFNQSYFDGTDWFSD